MKAIESHNREQCEIREQKPFSHTEDTEGGDGRGWRIEDGKTWLKEERPACAQKLRRGKQDERRWGSGRVLATREHKEHKKRTSNIQHPTSNAEH
jgi:hypothetical protein